MNEKARNNWKKWRYISDAIVRHRDYRYGSKHVDTLLKMARFAQSMMGHFNYLTYRLP